VVDDPGTPPTASGGSELPASGPPLPAGSALLLLAAAGLCATRVWVGSGARAHPVRADRRFPPDQ
jgi:hypothetical protein